MKFQCVYINEKTGVKEKRTIEGDDEKEVRELLGNHMVIKIAKEIELPIFRQKPKNFYKYYPRIMHRFAFMLQQGLQITEILNLLHYENRKVKTLSDAFETMQLNIKKGRSLTECMKIHNDIYDNIVLASVEVGEESGYLSNMFFSLAAFYKKKMKLSQAIKQSLFMPISTIVGALAALVYIMMSIMPRILEVFVDLDVELPWATRVMVTATEWFAANKLGLLIGTIISMLLWVQAVRQPKIKLKIDKYMLKMPVIGIYMRKINMAVMTSNLSVMLGSGILTEKAFEISAEVLTNAYLKSKVIEARTSILQGNLMSESFRATGDFDLVFISILKVGEDTGQIATVLAGLSEEYFTEVEALSVKTSTSITIVALLIVFGMVTLMGLAIYGPIQGISEGLANS